ncbi:MAG: DUF4349 domain-containing protein, partial [Microbacterium sp.]
MNVEDVTLPALSEDRIDEIEAALFATIAHDRAEQSARAEGERRRRARRGRVWMGGAAAAAVVAVAAILAPSMPGILGGATSGASEGSSVIVPESAGGSDGDLGAPDEASVDGLDPVPGASGEQSATSGREIIARASATVRVDDVDAAAAAIGDEASRLGGYVEAMSIGRDRVQTFGAPEGDSPDGSMIEPVPAESSGAWITVRVPAESLDQATAALSELGEVTASQVDRRDVTAEAVDLRARVEALQASVDRLTALVADAESTRDLIAVEEALASRQADLEAYRQQLKSLDDQVGMSSLTVALTTPQPVAEADPAGFGDGLAAGWSGLVATVNGMVLAIGFLLPWLAVIAVAVLVVWLVRRTVKRRRRAHAMTDADASPSAGPARRRAPQRRSRRARGAGSRWRAP